MISYVHMIGLKNFENGLTFYPTIKNDMNFMIVLKNFKNGILGKFYTLILNKATQTRANEMIRMFFRHYLPQFFNDFMIFQSSTLKTNQIMDKHIWEK